MAKDSDRKSQNSKKTHSDDSNLLHPVTRHIVLLLDGLGVHNFVTIKGATTTVTFQIDEDVDLDDFITVQPSIKAKQ